jgi:hypothetical protein
LGRAATVSPPRPWLRKGKLYFASEQGTVYVVKPGADFTVLATNQMGEVCMATPAISEGALFFPHARARRGGGRPEMKDAGPMFEQFRRYQWTTIET